MNQINAKENFEIVSITSGVAKACPLCGEPIIEDENFDTENCSSASCPWFATESSDWFKANGIEQGIIHAIVEADESSSDEEIDFCDDCLCVHCIC